MFRKPKLAAPLQFVLPVLEILKFYFSENVSRLVY